MLAGLLTSPADALQELSDFSSIFDALLDTQSECMAIAPTGCPEVEVLEILGLQYRFWSFAWAPHSSVAAIPTAVRGSVMAPHTVPTNANTWISLRNLIRGGFNSKRGGLWATPFVC